MALNAGNDMSRTLNENKESGLSAITVIYLYFGCTGTVTMINFVEKLHLLSIPKLYAYFSQAVNLL